MRILNNLKIQGSRDKAIMLDIRYQETGVKKPLVIFCHGFKGFKDWGHFNLIAKTIAKAGFVVCKFNFSYNGGSEEQVIDFPDLEAFGQNNISTELNDLGALLDVWENENQFISDQEVDREQVILMGHSRGGGVTILKTAEDSRIKKLVSLAAINSVGRLFTNEDFLEQWKRDGVIYIGNGRTKQQMPMYYQYYEDYISNHERLNIGNAAKRIDVPWLIVHGSDDPTVPVTAAHELHNHNKNSELLIVDGADHTFGGKHPWSHENLPESTLIWIEKFLEFMNV